MLIFNRSKDFAVYPDTNEVGIGNKIIKLRPKEMGVLQLLLFHSEKTVTRIELLEKVWGYTSDTETRTIDNFIARLRKYFEKNPRKPEYIITVREKGYQLLSTPEKK